MDIASFFYERSDGLKGLKTALVLLKSDGTEEKYSWSDYQKKAISVAEWLKTRGIKKGDFVAIVPLNLPDSFFALLGIILIGAVPVPINVQLLKEANLVDLRKIIDDCKPKLVLANESLYEFMPEIDPYIIEGAIARSELLMAGFGYRLTYYSDSYSVAKDDDLLIMPYTSGTSGQPKGVMLTHKNVINRLKAVTSALAIMENERILSYLPLGHIAELITTFFGQIYAGYTVYFSEYAKETIESKEKFRENFPSVLRQIKLKIFVAVPRIWMSFRNEIENKIKNLPIPPRIIPQWLKKHLIKKGLGFSQTRVFISTGAKIGDDDLAFFASLSIPIYDIYGQTETAGPLTLNGTVLGPDIKITLENEEIVVIGDCVMSGYYQNPLANERVFSKNRAGETVYHTGDTGIAQKGKIFWTGRMGNGFKWSNGEYANPDKIELLEEEIKKIDARINEVIICGANRSHSVALVFSENYSDKNLHEKIRQELPKIGEGMFKIRRFALINSAELELTPTMKVKRKVVLEKLNSTIDSLYVKK